MRLCSCGCFAAAGLLAHRRHEISSCLYGRFGGGGEFGV